MVEKMRKNKLQLFGHVMRRKEIKAVRVVMKTNVEGKRKRTGPKNRWSDTIENDIRAVGVCE
jgi:ribosomal 50S subunit-associated protein YjgA (DUF615 family)